MQPGYTPEQQHLSRLEHDPKYAEEWAAKHAGQKRGSESPLSGAKHANKTPIRISVNTTSHPDSFFNSYWFAALVIGIFLFLVFIVR